VYCYRPVTQQAAATNMRHLKPWEGPKWRMFGEGQAEKLRRAGWLSRRDNQ
jgi:hypothetical protein